LDILNLFSRTTRKLILVTAVLLLYGYSCRLLGIYFFWESKTIGWVLFWIMIIAILRDSMKHRKLQKRNTLPEKIGIGLSIFIIVLKGVLFFVTRQTSAYDSAVNYIKTNAEIQNKVGTVRSVFLVPFGGMSISADAQGSAGQADLYFIVKGDKKYMDLNLLMNKEFTTDWQIEIQE